MQAVWTVVIFGAAILLLSLVAGISIVWLAVFAALWLVVLVPLVRAVRRKGTTW